MIEQAKALQLQVQKLYKSLQVDDLASELTELDTKMSDSAFWDDPTEAAKVQKRRMLISDTVDAFITMQKSLQDVIELCQMMDDDTPDQEMQKELEQQLAQVEKKINAMEFKKMLGGEMDSASAIVSVNSGAGGTESQDWVAMLVRMYLRWAEHNGFSATLVDELAGEEAGYKHATIIIEGNYVFGYLQAEAGVHRLVRISPFDSASRRHTSFASVSVVPQIDDEIDIEINEADLRIDTYRASGAGGQHVNTTDSAVRITHIPTGVVAQCQNERSQHKNKASAMKILKSRLYERERNERDRIKSEAAGVKKGIDFGSQIRSYVLHPYQMIKDHRTSYESGKTQAVLDGEIDDFIREYLIQKK